MAMKEKALRRLADKLNAAGVTWAIGAGYLLAYHGIGQGYHDFDIIVDEKDAEAADRVLSRLGMRSPQELKGDAFHCAYHFDGADIDVMAGMVIHHEDGQWHIRFDGDSVDKTVSVLGAQVHLMYLEDWYVFYALIGHDKKAQAIEEHFRRHGVKHPERFDQVAREPLPEALQASINALLEEST